jgi:hypothetical protein
MKWVPVLMEGRMEDLGDAGHRRTPGVRLLRRFARHARNVQDTSRPRRSSEPMEDITGLKAVLVVEDGLPDWQKLNVAAFAVSGVAAARPDLIGEPYFDADGNEYLAMLGLPMVVLTGNATKVQRAFRRAADRSLRTTIYTRDLFTTGDDTANRGAVAAVPFASLDVVGFAVVGPRRVIDKVADGLRMHS